MNTSRTPDPILPDLPNGPVWESEHNVGASIRLMPLVRAYALHWPFLLASAVLGAVLFYALSYAVKPMFESAAVFLPPQQHSNMVDSPFAGLWNTTSAGSTYPGLLQSHSVVDTVIHKLDLQKAYRTPDLDATRMSLQANTHTTSDAAGFFTLRVTDHDPELARKIANAYLDALVQVDTRLAIDAATQQQGIFQRELGRAKDALEAAQEQLTRAQLSTGVVSAQAQTQSGLNAIDQLRVQIQARQVELAALRQSETEQAPEVQRMRSEVGALEAQLHAMESGTTGGAGGGLSARRAPEVNQEFMRLTREVEYQRSLYDIITKQFETASMQARTTSTGIQIVDYPETPRHKSAPSRRLWAMGGGGVCFFFAFLAVFVADRSRVIAQDPERLAEARSLRDAVRHPVWKP